MYVKASNNYNEGPFTITTPVYTSCVGRVTFSYHMYGSSMGTLTLEGKTGNVWATLWSKTGDQGSMYCEDTNGAAVDL